MADDIVPASLETINQQFDLKANQSTILRVLLQAAKNNKATYLDANKFAIEIGKILGDVLGDNISSAVLPDGRMYYNIGRRILGSTLKKNHDLITGFTDDVQGQLNKKAGIGLKVQTPAFDEDRVAGLVNRLDSEANFDDVAWMLKEPVVNFSQSVVDEAVKANVQLHYKVGLHPTITRSLVGKGCAWCRRLAGKWEYTKAPADVYKRHENDRCTVDYNPGTGKHQDVWSKQWKDPEKDAKIEARKQLAKLPSGRKFVKSKHGRIRQSERDINDKDIAEALAHPLKAFPIETDKLGRRAQKHIGEKTTVVMNPDTNNVITTYQTSSRKRRKYSKGSEE